MACYREHLYLYLYSCWEGFTLNLIFLDFYKKKFLKIQIILNLGKNIRHFVHTKICLSRFHGCCWRHTVVIKALYSSEVISVEEVQTLGERAIMLRYAYIAHLFSVRTGGYACWPPTTCYEASPLLSNTRSFVNCDSLTQMYEKTRRISMKVLYSAMKMLIGLGSCSIQHDRTQIVLLPSAVGLCACDTRTGKS